MKPKCRFKFIIFMGGPNMSMTARLVLSCTVFTHLYDLWIYDSVAISYASIFHFRFQNLTLTSLKVMPFLGQEDILRGQHLGPSGSSILYNSLLKFCKIICKCKDALLLRNRIEEWLICAFSVTYALLIWVKGFGFKFFT